MGKTAHAESKMWLVLPAYYDGGNTNGEMQL
jgi:hypothetical protein